MEGITIMEITANALQTVAENQNILFTDTVVCGRCSIVHREGSGLVRLKGLTDQCRARYKVSFGGNLAIPTGGTVGAISVAIAIDGEAVPTTNMIVTPAAVEEFWNVFGAIYLDIPRGCCSQISVRNTSTQAIDVQNANLIIERVA
jgi:hypothetical protein